MSSHQIHLLARDDPTDRELVQMLGQLDDLLERLGASEATWSDWLAAVDPGYRASARNIVHYWAIRQADLRGLQTQLAAFGLSSLGRSESHVEATLRVVRSAVGAILEDAWHPPAPAAVAADEGHELLQNRSVELLGPAPAGRETRIMVTLPSEAATNRDLIRGLLECGMNLARINCAHDDPTAWRAMAEHVRHASAVLGRSCLVAMDLSGPTGEGSMNAIYGCSTRRRVKVTARCGRRLVLQLALHATFDAQQDPPRH